MSGKDLRAAQKLLALSHVQLAEIVPGVSGKELRAARKRLGLTQAEVAELVGVTANTIARQERGEMRIREPQARLLRMLFEQRAPRRR